jgi:hypothetical protein
MPHYSHPGHPKGLPCANGESGASIPRLARRKPVNHNTITNYDGTGHCRAFAPACEACDGRERTLAGRIPRPWRRRLPFDFDASRRLQFRPLRRHSQIGKAVACKAMYSRFESGCRLHFMPSNPLGCAGYSSTRNSEFNRLSALPNIRRMKPRVSARRFVAEAESCPLRRGGQAG